MIRVLIKCKCAIIKTGLGEDHEIVHKPTGHDVAKAAYGLRQNAILYCTEVRTTGVRAAKESNNSVNV